MKILKVFEDVELILVDLEVNMGSEKEAHRPYVRDIREK